MLACRLEQGASFGDLVDELRSRDVDDDTAREWTILLLRHLSELGAVVAGPSAVEPEATQQIRIAGLDVALEYSGRELFDLIGASYSHLSAGSFSADAIYRLYEAGEFVFIAEDDRPPLLVERQLAAVRLKGMLIEQVLRSSPHLAALHAACLTFHGRGLLLLGSPGAGKTTLSLSLLKRGCSYGGDDVTLVRGDGLVEGVPLAPGVKESAWAIVEPIVEKLLEQPVHIRPDGLKVRLAPLKEKIVGQSCPVGNIVLLQRGPDKEAQLKPIDASAALAELLRESRSPDGRCSTEIMRTLAELVREAGCFELHYTEARDAVPLLCELIRR